jgi:hypothetical protein
LLKAKGITPMVVLHHFSNPPWINAAGGWTNAATIPAFVDYVRQLVAALKDRVYLWNTFNEPDTYACVAYLLGGFPPQRKWKLGQFRRVIAHGARPCAGQPRHPARRRRRTQTGSRHRQELDVFPRLQKFSPWDRATAFGCHYTFNKFVLDAFLGGGRRRASTFIGLNYYGRVRFHHFRAMIPASGAPVKTLKDFGFVCDDMVERYPEGMGKSCRISTGNSGCPFTSRNTARRRRRNFPRARPARKPRRAARRDGRRRGRARIFLLVAAGQFRVAVRLHQKVRPAGRGFHG